MSSVTRLLPTLAINGQLLRDFLELMQQEGQEFK